MHLLTNQVIDCQTIGPGLYQFIYNPSTINSQSKCTGAQWLRGSYGNNSEEDYCAPFTQSRNGLSNDCTRIVTFNPSTIHLQSIYNRCAQVHRLPGGPMVIIVRRIYVHLLPNHAMDCQTIGPGLYRSIHLQSICNPSTTDVHRFVT